MNSYANSNYPAQMRPRGYPGGQQQGYGGGTQQGGYANYYGGGGYGRRKRRQGNSPYGQYGPSGAVGGGGNRQGGYGYNPGWGGNQQPYQPEYFYGKRRGGEIVRGAPYMGGGLPNSPYQMPPIQPMPRPGYGYY